MSTLSTSLLYVERKRNESTFSALIGWVIRAGALCLRNVHVVVPEAVERGSKVEMKCLYDLEQEVLYSVKWYRGDREFCRYSPRDVPPLKIFRIPGIEVDVSLKLKHKGPTFNVCAKFSFRKLS
ncbi:hypothetical protein SFRURICE_009572 [Spodoptera frugiperda]|nr:hypothetical protein SFRURICE_009572 [Spodoptera frugiperda]